MKNYKSCIHFVSEGQVAVYVMPSCPRMTMIKGQCVSSKKRCEDCRSGKEREAAK